MYTEPAGTWRKYNVASTSWRCIDVEATLYLRHVPAGSYNIINTYSTELNVNVLVRRIRHRLAKYWKTSLQ